MSLLRSLFLHAPAGIAMAAAHTPSSREILTAALNELREQRAEDLASLADRAGRSGARLAICERSLDQWKAYAKELERRCLAAGIEIPSAPDE